MFPQFSEISHGSWHRARSALEHGQEFACNPSWPNTTDALVHLLDEIEIKRVNWVNWIKLDGLGGPVEQKIWAPRYRPPMQLTQLSWFGWPTKMSQFNVVNQFFNVSTFCLF